MLETPAWRGGTMRPPRAWIDRRWWVDPHLLAGQARGRHVTGTPMRFEINAADRDTGEEYVIALVAETEQEAMAKANAAGYLVGEVEPAPEVRGSALFN